MCIYHRVESPQNIASTPLHLTCTPIVSSFIGSDVSPITDEESFINAQQTSTPKRYNFCVVHVYVYCQQNIFIHRSVNAEQGAVNVGQTTILDEVIMETNAILVDIG